MSLAPGIVRTRTMAITAHVVPLFKKGSKSKPSNYRPVSLTSVVGKLMEKGYLEIIYIRGSG